MSGKGLRYGLNLGKKKPNSSKPPPAKRKPVFGGDDSDDEPAAKGEGAEGTAVVEIGGLEDGFSTTKSPPQSLPERKLKPNKKNALQPNPPTLTSKTGPVSALGDLASRLTSRKNAAAAEALDSTVYEYDAVYDSMKPVKQAKSNEYEERRPQYMTGLLAASEVRKRDMQIAEERKTAKEREAEGDEFADKEKFVTGAYKKLQEENRRLREEEKRREEAEAKSNQTGGMTSFYREMLDRADKQHAEAVKASLEVAKSGASRQKDSNADEEVPAEKEKSEARIAKEINEKGGSVAVNEDGEIVDKRQLLKGGLNVAPKKRDQPKEVRDPRQDGDGSNRRSARGYFGADGKRAMVARQSRMMEEQLAATLKRSRDAEEDEKQKTIEVMTKSKKTEGDISSARERYLARKKAAEEAKKGQAG